MRISIYRMFGISFKSAWFMAHRPRYAMTDGPLTTRLVGVVEADEPYVGGRRKGKHGQARSGRREENARRGGRSSAMAVRMRSMWSA